MNIDLFCNYIPARYLLNSYSKKLVIKNIDLVIVIKFTLTAE